MRKERTYLFGWSDVKRTETDERRPDFLTPCHTRNDTTRNLSAMASTPPPGTSSAKASPEVSAADGVTWRVSVPQSARNAEVREISRVLACLEPGSSAAAKLRLAMQFEDTVFKSSNSAEDYRKKLNKRLKKLQKNYKPEASATSGDTSASKSLTSDQKVARLNELKSLYGETLGYILKNASKAIEEMRAKQGDDKAKQLQQHTDGVKVWAADLGIGDGKTMNHKMSSEQLEKLGGHLERRLENIRSHVVKLADPRKFMAETLSRRQSDFASQAEASKQLSSLTKRCYDQLSQYDASSLIRDADQQQIMKVLVDGWESTNTPVPFPSSRNSSVENDRRAALVHLEKMRAASDALLAYLALPDKQELSVKNIQLSNTYTTISEGIEICSRVAKEHRKRTAQPYVTLEDAWRTRLVWRGDSDDGSTERIPPPKKRRFQTRSRVLFTPHRKVPPNLLPAFRRKQARLETNGLQHSLVLDFRGTGRKDDKDDIKVAFTMTIYFVPLLVTLRAATNESDARVNRTGYWTPVQHGLPGQEVLSVWGANTSRQNDHHHQLLAPVVEARLEEASQHATAVLRQCFAQTRAKSKQNASEFEIEILEATTLLEFLQLARTSFQPEWEDD